LILYWLGDTKHLAKKLKKSEDMFKYIMRALFIFTLVCLLLASLGCSVTSLQCGVDGDSSYVNLNSTPSTISENSRNLAELCGFAYEEESNATTT